VGTNHNISKNHKSRNDFAFQLDYQYTKFKLEIYKEAPKLQSLNLGGKYVNITD